MTTEKRPGGRKRKTLTNEVRPFNRRFAENLRRLLEESGMTNRKFVTELHQRSNCDVSYGAANAWVRGACLPEYEHLEAIGAVLAPGGDYRLLLPHPEPIKIIPRKRRKKRKKS